MEKPPLAIWESSVLAALQNHEDAGISSSLMRTRCGWFRSVSANSDTWGRHRAPQRWFPKVRESRTRPQVRLGRLSGNAGEKPSWADGVRLQRAWGRRAGRRRWQTWGLVPWGDSEWARKATGVGLGRLEGTAWRVDPHPLGRGLENSSPWEAGLEVSRRWGWEGSVGIPWLLTGHTE